jgi:hypothetical protein
MRVNNNNVYNDDAKIPAIDKKPTIMLLYTIPNIIKSSLIKPPVPGNPQLLKLNIKKKLQKSG